MNYLIIGNPMSMWTQNYYENCLKFQAQTVTILSRIWLDDEICAEKWKRYDVKVIGVKSFVKMKKIFNSIYFKAWIILFCLFNKGKYDIIEAQFADPFSIFLSYLIRGKNDKILLSYWGSDLLRVSDEKLKKINHLVEKCDLFTFDNIDLQEKFISLYGRQNLNKCIVARYGLPILDEMNKKEQCKKEKIVIAVGYNGIPEQQHLLILNELDKLDENKKQQIILYLQMTYGGDENYRELVKCTLKKIGCQYKVFEQRMSDGEVAGLRNSVDVYINGQTTDALSGSVCEYLYGGAILVNAVWLHYKELDTESIDFIEFSDFRELTTIINGIINKKYKIDIIKNKNAVWNIRSWEQCKKIWIQVYRKLGI